MDLFHWSLHEIDLTDIESLIPFAFHYPRWKDRSRNGETKSSVKYADEVDWL